MADANNHSTPHLEALYRRWSRFGAGLHLSGNIQLIGGTPSVPAIDDSGQEQLAWLADAGTYEGTHFWAQRSHTRRQVQDAINASPLARSSVDIDVMRGAGFSFAIPREMTEELIQQAIGKFDFAAWKVREACFTGVFLHGAHGLPGVAVP